MKNTLKLFALVAFMFAAFATSAQTAKPIKLGHLDVQKVMTSMPEFKKAQDDLAAKEQEIRKELTAMHVQAVGKEGGFTYIFAATPNFGQGALLYTADNSEDVLPLVKKKLGIQ